VWFVPLAPLQSADGILPAVAHALSFLALRTGDARRQLLDHLSGRALLLVLDNLEHLLDQGGAEVIVEILQAAPGVKVLATSRARLSVHGEHVLVVGGMAYPIAPDMVQAAGERHSAIDLFLSSARRARADLSMTADDLASVAEICQLVEGMPLAIVLAASWVSLLSLQEIASEIRRSLDILETELRGVSADGVAGGARHRSIRVVFDRSWDLLSGREREVFQSLSVFRGSFGRQAAQRVAAASLRELMALVDKSLLQRTPGDRYQVHELLRRYGTERLDEAPDAGERVHERHSAYYAGIMERWSGGWIVGPQWTAMRNEMDAEIENARAAWDWAVRQGDVKRLDQTVEGLCRCYNRWRRREQGMEAIRVAVERIAAMREGEARIGARSAISRVLAKILAWQAMFSLKVGDPDLARQLLAQSLSALGDVPASRQQAFTEIACVLLRMGAILEDMRGTGRPAAVLLGDIDDFRRVNNTYGHATGDIVLAGVGHCFQEGIEELGVFGRLGGEEFVGLLPGVGREESVAVADGIRQRVGECVFESTDGRDLRATISIGIALFPQDAADLVSLYQLADRAAYEAKRRGKDMVCLFGEVQE
jgi:diguanylate cyclase (GGDEF)-like protein